MFSPFSFSCRSRYSRGLLCRLKLMMRAADLDPGIHVPSRAGFSGLGEDGAGSDAG